MTLTLTYANKTSLNSAATVKMQCNTS